MKRKIVILATLVFVGVLFVVATAVLSLAEPRERAVNKTPNPNLQARLDRKNALRKTVWEARQTANVDAIETAYLALLAEFDEEQIHYKYGAWLLEQDRPAEALAQLEPVILDWKIVEQPYHKNVYSLLLLAQAYEATGQPIKADEIYLRAAHLGPWRLGDRMPRLAYDGDDPVKAEAKVKAMAAISRIGDYPVGDPEFPVAEQLMREALVLAPSWPELLYYGGWVMMCSKHWYEADELYDKADALSDDPILEEAIVRDRRYVDSALWYKQQHPDQQP